MYGTYTSIICTHNTPNVPHTSGQVEAKILYPNLTPMCGLFPMSKADPMVVGRKKRPLFEEIVRKSFHTLELLEPTLGRCQPKMPWGIYPTYLSNPHMSIDVHFLTKKLFNKPKMAI